MTAMFLCAGDLWVGMRRKLRSYRPPENPMVRAGGYLQTREMRHRFDGALVVTFGTILATWIGTLAAMSDTATTLTTCPVTTMFTEAVIGTTSTGRQPVDSVWPVALPLGRLITTNPL